MKKNILFLCIFFICTLIVNSFGASISGTITESKSGENLISLTVVIYQDSLIEGKKIFKGTLTNKFGFYTLTNIPEGKYTIVAKGVGFDSYIKQIALASEENLKLNIEMKEIDIRTQEITVEADKLNDATSRISTVTVSPLFISKMPSIGGEIDIFRTLQLLPGVKQANELSSGLYIRGGSPDQNLTLLDGVIVYNPAHLGGFLSVFNTDAIRDIRLIKGAFPAEYGGRLSSVLDMTMKEGTKEKFSGSAGISLISSRLTLEGPIDDNSTFMISARRMYLDLVLMLTLPAEEDFPNYYFYDLNAKINYKISDNDRLFVSGFLCNDVLQPPDMDNEGFDLFWGNKTANIRWMHIVNEEIFTNFSLIYTSYNFGSNIFNNRRTNSFYSKSYIEDLAIRGEAQYFPFNNHKMKFGFENIFHNFKSMLQLDFYRNDLNMPEKIINSVETAIFLQDEIQVTDKLSTNIGGRGYYFQSGNYFAFEPRLAASYRLFDNTTLNFSGALAHQFLHLIVRNDITLPTDLWFPSNEIIEPEKAWQGVFGIEQILNEGEYLLSLEVYYKDMRNLYEYKDDQFFIIGVPFEGQFTKGRGEAYGIELFLNKRLGAFTGWIGYTLSWTRRQFDDLNSGKWFYPRYDRRHDINIVLTYQLGKSWELGATWYYGTGQAYTMPTGVYYFSSDEDINYQSFNEKYQYTELNSSRLPAFHKLDLNFMYKFSWFDLPWQLSINLYNLYNNKNPFAWYIDFDYLGNKSTKVLKQITLFPFIPTFGISFKF